MAVRKYWLRAMIVAGVALVLWIAIVSWKQLVRNERIESEVSALQSEAEKIRRENETLSEKIQYFSTADFREQEAKEKLGMKKEEEQAVVISLRPRAVAESEIAGTERSVAALSDEMVVPNYQKWWQVFFGNR